MTKEQIIQLRRFMVLRAQLDNFDDTIGNELLKTFRVAKKSILGTLDNSSNKKELLALLAELNTEIEQVQAQMALTVANSSYLC